METAKTVQDSELEKINTTTPEVWKPIEGCPDYEISSLGRVKSFKRGKPRFLKPEKDCWGYLRVTLFSAKGPKRKFSIHRLIACAFIPNPTKAPQINHVNCIKTDNAISNLEWVTQWQNMAHARQHGLCKKR